MTTLNAEESEAISHSLQKLCKPNLQPDLNAKSLRDSGFLLRIFPEEIWLQVAGKINEAETLARLNNSSLYFRNLLIPNRVFFLFPLVYPHLSLHLHGNTNFAKEHAENKNVLKIRQVCKKWCQGVDKIFHNEAQHYAMKEQLSQNDLLKNLSFKENNHDDKTAKCIIKTEHFSDYNSQYIQRFLEFFMETHGLGKVDRSPFVGKAVKISCHLSSSEHVRNFVPVLEKYGHHIWYCTMKITNNCTSELTFLTQIKSVLVLLPNLRVLNICNDTYYSSNVQSYSVNKSKETAVIGLPKLEMLEYVRTRDIPVSLFNELVRENTHVSMLQVERFSSAFENYNIYDFHMANLNKLYMQYFSPRDFQKMNNPSVNWPLTSLYLDFFTCPFFEWPELFRVLERKWGNTLTDLMVSLPQTTVRQEELQIIKYCSSYQLNLQKVKRLKIVISNYTSLDFILSLRGTLEILEIEVQQDFGIWWETPQGKQARESAKLSALMECLRNPYDCYGTMLQQKKQDKVWAMMPKLKVMKIIHGLQVRSYHRPRMP